MNRYRVTDIEAPDLPRFWDADMLVMESGGIQLYRLGAGAVASFPAQRFIVEMIEAAA